MNSWNPNIFEKNIECIFKVSKHWTYLKSKNTFLHSMFELYRKEKDYFWRCITEPTSPRHALCNLNPFWWYQLKPLYIILMKYLNKYILQKINKNSFWRKWQPTVANTEALFKKNIPSLTSHTQFTFCTAPPRNS